MDDKLMTAGRTTSAMPRTRPTVWVLACCLLVLVACGGRVSTSEILAAERLTGSSTQGEGTELGVGDPATGGTLTEAGEAGTGGERTPGASGRPAASAGRTGRTPAAGGSGPGASAPGVTADTVNVGGIILASGAAGATLGQGGLKGLEAYWRVVNDKGGIHGRKIEYKFYDSGYDAAKGAAVAKRLVEQDGVFAVVPGSDPFGMVGAIPYLEQQGVPVFGADGYAKQEYQSPVVFPTPPSGTRQARIQAWYAIKVLKAPRIALLHNNSDISLYTIEAAEKQLQRMGQPAVSKQGLESDSSDCTPQMLQIQSSRADVVLHTMNPTTLIFCMQAASRAGYSPQWLGPVGARFDLVADNVGPYSDGMIAEAIYLRPDTHDSPEAREMQAAMRKYYPDVKVDEFQAGGWVAGKLFATALEAAGPNPTRAGVIAAANRINELKVGFGSPLTFRPDYRDPVPGVYFVKYDYGTRGWKYVSDIVQDPLL